MEFSRKKYGVIGLGFLLFSFAAYFGGTYERGPIYSFNAERDTSAILTIFEKNRYWLLANEDSSPAFMLKYRTPNTNPSFFGKLIIKVLRQDNKVAGFVAYHREENHWRLLFLAVDHEFRGHGYGALLARYAMNEMINKYGAQKIVLWTRVSNLPAQRIYKELGFTEVLDSYGYLLFEYIV